MEAIVVHDFYFVQKRDVIGLLGLSSIHKCTIAIRMLAYDAIAHYVNKDCRLNESIALECLKRFVKAIQACFESNYLKQPTLVDVKKQKKINKKRRFPSMFASIDYMHSSWTICPLTWQGQFQDKNKTIGIILETIVNQSL